MSIGLIVVVVAIAAFINLFSNKNTKVLPSSTEVKNNSNNKNKSSDTTNILLLGDTTDSMMVATVDAGNKNIKLTPVEDATYVDTSDKETLLKSLEKKTNLDLDKFLQVNFSDLLNAVSVLGDIQLNVKQEDLTLINNLIPKFYAECEDGDKGRMELLTKTGLQNLNEYQAMAYAAVIAKDVDKQKEMLILPFLIWYSIEWLCRLAQYCNSNKAYRNISFEREAYANEKDLAYLGSRKPYAWTEYLRIK